MSKNQPNIWTLDCSYFQAEFPSLNSLVEAVKNSGMDPNYEIMCNGKTTGEKVIDLIQM